MMRSSTHIMFLNGNERSNSKLAIGCLDELVIHETQDAFNQASKFLNKHRTDFVFGWFSYDIKNDIEKLASKNPFTQDFPLLYLFVPEHLAEIDAVRNIEMLRGEKHVIQEFLTSLDLPKHGNNSSIVMKASLGKEEYLEQVTKVKRHIQLGDIYEANFCYEFSGMGQIDPLESYKILNERTNAPFSVFAQIGERFVLSASPERFIRKEGKKVISQPIKGTKRRGISEEDDLLLIEELRNSPKDRSENIMIVDLVRNDLSKIADPGSVNVDELCEIYSFQSVHQMISTVSAEVSLQDPVDIIKALFPMGSMTGAPKIRAMQLMDELENRSRGLYSGTIGYFNPNGDFDLNVVIRTILYDRTKHLASFSVGGAITDLSDPLEEYEETLLKAKALLETLSP